MTRTAPTDPNDPHEWLRRARSSAQLARCEKDGVDPADLCFQAQQAAEKAIKAVLVSRRLPVPRSHDIALLLQRAAAAGAAVPPSLMEATLLTRHAIESRYPSDEYASHADLEAALRRMDAILDWAERMVLRHGEVRERLALPPYSAVDPCGTGGTPDLALLADIIGRIVKVADPERVILFGSAARGDMQPDSDIDLIIVLRDRQASSTALKDATRMALWGVRCGVDFVLVTAEQLERYGHAPGLVYHAALIEGRVVYEQAAIA